MCENRCDISSGVFQLSVNPKYDMKQTSTQKYPRMRGLREETKKTIFCISVAQTNHE